MVTRGSIVSDLAFSILDRMSTSSPRCSHNGELVHMRGGGGCRLDNFKM